MAIEEVVEGVTGEVATNLEEIAAATRRINPNSVGGFVIGLGVGVAVGFYFGRKWNKEKLRAEAFAESEREVEVMREVYQQKAVAATPKPTVDEVIAEKGYAVVAPVPSEPARPLRAPVPIQPSPVSAPPVVTYEGGKDKNEGWDFAKELSQRSEDEPYIIHQDEFSENAGHYSHVAYTYYAEDGVLVDTEDGHPVPHGDLVVGVANLRFGHGSDDMDVVFVRNDKLEQEMEICRVPRSYEEEVLGHEHDAEG